MQLEPTPDSPKILMATVYLKSHSGRSPLREGNAAPIDPRSYLPSPETINQAIAELQQLGFKIEAQGVTLSISGPPELFEKTCGVKISLEEKIVHEHREAKAKTQFIFKSSQPVMHIQKLHNIIDGITVSIRGIPFEGYSLQK